MDKAPTIPSDNTTFDVTAKITTVVIIVKATSVTAKLEEYITPENVFLYTKKINNPKQNANAKAITISNILTLATLSKKLDLKISLNVISIFLLFLYP
jgi:hypothetical protein